MVSPKAFIVAYGLALLSSLVASSPVVPRYFQRSLFSRHNITASIVEAELGPQLSSGSLIFGSNSSLWANATGRYNTLLRLDIQVVVEPAAESDVAKVVSGYSRGFREFNQSPANSSRYRSDTAMIIASISS